jgi:hypothetical protein
VLHPVRCRQRSPAPRLSECNRSVRKTTAAFCRQTVKPELEDTGIKVRPLNSPLTWHALTGSRAWDLRRRPQDCGFCVALVHVQDACLPAVRPQSCGFRMRIPAHLEAGRTDVDRPPVRWAACADAGPGRCCQQSQEMWFANHVRTASRSHETSQESRRLESRWWRRPDRRPRRDAGLVCGRSRTRARDSLAAPSVAVRAPVGPLLRAACFHIGAGSITWA